MLLLEPSAIAELSIFSDKSRRMMLSLCGQVSLRLKAAIQYSCELIDLVGQSGLTVEQGFQLPFNPLQQGKDTSVVFRQNSFRRFALM